MLRDSIGRFRDRGFEIEVLSTGDSLGRFAPAFESVGVRVHHLPLKKTVGCFAQLQSLIRVGKYDVVHVHTERAALWVELTARAAGVKRVVRSVHSVFEFSGWLRVRRALGRWFAARALGVHHIFVGPSVALNEARRFGTPGVSVLNAVDTDRFVPSEGRAACDAIRNMLGIAPDAFVLASVGRCTDVKQHDHVIRTVALLSEDFPNICYLHVGDGPELNAEVELAESSRVVERCQFLGERDDVLLILQAADIFVMPSKYEGLCLAAVEASACGVPVIGYDVPGLRDAVVDGKTGLLVPAVVQELADAISRLVADAELRRMYGTAGRAFVKDRFSLNRWVDEVMSVYEMAGRK